MSDRSKRPTLKQTPGQAATRAAGHDPDAATSVWTGPPQAPQVAQPQLRAISKKTPGGKPSDMPERALPAVKLRAMSEFSSGQITPPSAQALGYLAPPRDPSETRARRRRDLIVWSSICVMIACAVALGIWFMAR